jgi:hypothetical protein
MRPNAKAANNDKATANMRPSAVATARGKPSDFMAFSPQPGRHRGMPITKLLIDFGGVVI